MLSIFSCAFGPSVCVCVCVLRNIYLGLLPTFWLGCLFYWCWAAWAVCVFWRLILYQFVSFAIIFSHSEGCLFIFFIVSGLIFRFLIHFEFIFVYGVRRCSNLILLHVTVQFSQHHYLKRLSLPHCVSLPPLSKTRHP